tara:strand:+ start:62 stop:262 length:201 start_codon:yes stop_codon:yes gene_type:complete
MLKFILLAIGLILIFEGAVYFLFSNNIYKMYKILKETQPDKIRFFSGVMILFGLCLIYITFKIYKI